MKIEHIIKVSLQDLGMVKDAIKYNEENNYIYSIVDNNLVHSECVLYLINHDYVISKNCKDDKLYFKHKSVIEED